MDDNQTHDTTDTETVWCIKEISVLEKRQSIEQIKKFADSSVLPLRLIFRGEGNHIKIEEKRRWDNREHNKLRQPNSGYKRKMQFLIVFDLARQVEYNI